MKGGEEMNAIMLNQINPDKIPDTVRARLCRGAAEMAMRSRSDPEHEKRYQKWLEEQKKK